MTWSFRHGLLAVAVLVGLTFWPVVSFDFVRWDDDINITQNPLLTEPWSWSLLAQFLTGEQALRFKPLHWLLFRGLGSVFAFEPMAWHACSLALHALASGLYYLVLRRVFALLNPGATSRRVDLAALAGAALWALHPLRAETVAWVTASTYPLTTVCLLGSFLFYLRAAADKVGRKHWFFCSWLLAVAAYACYPVGVTYGLWLMVADKWLLPKPAAVPGQAGERWRSGWRKYGLFLLPALAAVALTTWSRFLTPGIFTSAPIMESVPVSTRVVMALGSLSYLAGRLLWPANLTPNVPPVIWRTESILLVAALAVGAMAILLFAWWRRKRQPRVALICFGFAALSVPCLGLTERPTWPVDRYSYLVHLVVVGGVVGGVAFRRFPEQRGRQWLLGIGVTMVVVGAAIAARRQAAIWQDSPSLFAHMESHPGFTTSPRQQGHIYILWGRHEASAGRMERAAELFNRAQEAYASAIRVAVGRADYEEALSLLTHLERRFALTPIMQREKGAWLLRLGRAGEAMPALEQARARLPEDPRIAALLREAEEQVRTPGRVVP